MENSRKPQITILEEIESEIKNEEEKFAQSITRDMTGFLEIKNIENQTSRSGSRSSRSPAGTRYQTKIDEDESLVQINSV